MAEEGRSQSLPTTSEPPAIRTAATPEPQTGGPHEAPETNQSGGAPRQPPHSSNSSSSSSSRLEAWRPAAAGLQATADGSDTLAETTHEAIPGSSSSNNNNSSSSSRRHFSASALLADPSVSVASGQAAAAAAAPAAANNLSTTTPSPPPNNNSSSSNSNNNNTNATTNSNSSSSSSSSGEEEEGFEGLESLPAVEVPLPVCGGIHLSTVTAPLERAAAIIRCSQKTLARDAETAAAKATEELERCSRRLRVLMEEPDLHEEQMRAGLGTAHFALHLNCAVLEYLSRGEFIETAKRAASVFHLESVLEIEVRMQHAINLLKEKKPKEAVKYIKEHIQPADIERCPDIRRVLALAAMLDFPPPEYEHLLGEERTRQLVGLFINTSAAALGMTPEPLLASLVFAGLCAVKSGGCQDNASPNCPACIPELSDLIKKMPMPHRVRSHIICCVTGEPM
ncbi:erythroblast macrophage protein emp, putative, partial [Eimeria acervulina]